MIPGNSAAQTGQPDLHIPSTLQQNYTPSMLDIRDAGKTSKVVRSARKTEKPGSAESDEGGHPERHAQPVSVNTDVVPVSGGSDVRLQ